jgi:hypothetical protein
MPLINWIAVYLLIGMYWATHITVIYIHNHADKYGDGWKVLTSIMGLNTLFWPIMIPAYLYMRFVDKM